MGSNDLINQNRDLTIFSQEEGNLTNTNRNGSFSNQTWEDFLDPLALQPVVQVAYSGHSGAQAPCVFARTVVMKDGSSWVPKNEGPASEFHEALSFYS